MTSLITTLLLATQLNVADAKKRAVPHRHHAPKKHHVHATHRHHHYHVAKPNRPPKSTTTHSVYFYRGHWVMAHHKPNFMWKWNHVRGKWVIVFRF